jgi:D-2-hydroxyacid dehydrogenase (NADP+)
MTNVLILHTDDGAYREGLLPAFPDVDFWIHPTPPEQRELSPEVLGRLAEADAIISIGRWATPELLARCEHLKWFQCAITGTDHLRPLLADSDVVLTNARGLHGPQMAETVLLHMLAAYRQVPRLVANQASHRWDRFRPKVLETRTAVILGVGSIGEHVARMCKAMGMHTVGISRAVRPVEGFDEIRTREHLHDAAAEADFLIVLLPGEAENLSIVDRSVFSVMKPDAVLINVSRGKVVNEADLIEALRAGQIAWAGLDVFETSPLPPQSPLWSEPKVFITPFVGGQSDLYEQKLVGLIRHNLSAFLAGRPESMQNRLPLGGEP